TTGATASQSQYTISSQGSSPSLTAPNGKVTLSQAVLLNPIGNYYAVGTQGTNGVIINYNGSSWSTALTSSGITLSGIDLSTNYGLAVGYNSTNTSSIFQFNGSTWTLLGTMNNANLIAVSCDLPNSPTLCWIVGQQTSSSQKPLMYYTGTGIS